MQDTFRYIPPAALDELGHRLGIPVTRLKSVCDFFREFALDPVGEHLVLVCDGTACHTRGAADVVTALEKGLGIKVGETTADGRFTLRTVYCLGSCGLAPIVVIDDRVLGRVSLNAVAQVLKSVK